MPTQNDANSSVGHVSSVAPSHTPGPWQVRLFAIDMHDIEAKVAPGQFALVAQCPAGERERVTTAQMQANARLIAAAPELLEALRAALPSLHWANTHGSRCDEDIAAVETAISKAERGQ